MKTYNAHRRLPKTKIPIEIKLEKEIFANFTMRNKA